MNSLLLNSIYNRGLADFPSLNDAERSLFVVHDLDIYFEMEGGFEDYFLSGGHQLEIKTLIQTLRDIGDLMSLSLISEINQLKESDRKRMNGLCEKYYECRHSRWSLLEAAFLKRGMNINETE